MVTFSPEDMKAAQARLAERKKEREDAAQEVQKIAGQKATEASKQKREQLEESLKKRYLVAGGDLAGWETDKERLIRDSLAQEVLKPEQKQRAPAPLKRRKYRD